VPAISALASRAGPRVDRQKNLFARHQAALARAAARNPAPARKGRLAGCKVQPRQISFTAARRAVLASIRSGAATASLPASMTLGLPPRHPARPRNLRAGAFLGGRRPYLYDFVCPFVSPKANEPSSPEDPALDP
jgi:hypothetical protein